MIRWCPYFDAHFKSPTCSRTKREPRDFGLLEATPYTRVHAKVPLGSALIGRSANPRATS